jgi:hypothetical protein
MALPVTRRGRVLGALEPKQPDGLKPLGAYLRTPLPAAPASFPVPAAAWNMGGNSVWGDCTIAAAANSIAAADIEVAETDPIPTAAQSIAQYQALTGAKTPGDPNDTGLVLTDVLMTWATAGLFGDNVIAGYAIVDKASPADVRQAIASYGFCYVGVNLPQSAEDQFDAGQPWVYVGDEPIGGHCIILAGYDDTYLDGVTWGKPVRIGATWWAKYGSEAYAVIPQAFVQAGKGPDLDLASLKADIGALKTPPVPSKPKRSVWTQMWSLLFGDAR